MEAKQNRGLYVTIIIMGIIIVGLACALCFVLGGKYYNLEQKEGDKTTNNATNENKKEGTYADFVTTTKDSREDTIIVQNTANEDAYKIELKKNGDVILNYNSFKDEKITTNVLKGFIVSSSQNDIGDGRSVIFIKEDDSLEAIKMDDILFDEKINIISDFGDANNIVDIYVESETTNEYEPPIFKVYAKDINQQTFEITEYLK